MHSKEKKLKKYLDTLWAKLVKKRDGDTCQWCGKTKNLAADHIFSRKVNVTRWVVGNGITLDAGCHIFKKRYEPMLWALMVAKHVKPKQLKELEILHKSAKKVDLEATKKELEGMINDKS